jgi:iron(III) transport system permease protein
MPGRARALGAERLAIGVVLLGVAALVVVPIARLAKASTDASVGRVLRSPGLSTAAWHTVLVAVVVTAIAVPLGAAMALLLRRPELPARRTLRVAVVLPLVVPQFVLGYSWTQAYARAGFTDSVLGIHWDGLIGPVGVVVVLAVNAVPVGYLLATAGLVTRAQPELERAARASGATAWTALRTVTLPLLRPALAAAGVLTFVATLESFAVPQVLGTPAGFSTLTTRIYADLSLGSDPASFTDAVTLALGLVLIAALVLVPADVVLAPRLGAERSGQPAGPAQRPRRTRRSYVAAGALGGYVLLVAGLPLLALVAASITRAVGLPPTSGNWTLANFHAVLNDATAGALGHSLELAVAAATLLVVLGALSAVLERRRSGRLLATAATLTFVIPGSTLAVAVLIAYGRWFDSTLALILLAYLAKLWALAHRPISGALDRFPAAEWQAARASGAAPPTAVRTIWLPALAPALLGAWLLVFVTALHEVTMSSLLYSTRSQTLAVVVLNSQELGDVGRTAALSVLLTALLLAAVLPAWAVAHARNRWRAPQQEVAGAR